MAVRLWNLLFALSLMIGSGTLSAQETVTIVPERDYDQVMASGYLTVAFYDDFPPYSWDEGGEAKGVDVAIAKRLADRLGIQFRSFWLPPDENLEGDLRNAIGFGHYMRRGQLADIMMRVPYDRRYAYKQDSVGELINEMAVMFGPYSQERWRIAHDTQQLDDVPTIAVFQYNPIGVEIDTLPATYMTSFMQGRMRERVRHFNTIEGAFDGMERGEVAAVMGMQGEIDYYMNQHEGAEFALAKNGFPGISKQVWDVGMAVRATHRQLGYAVESEIDDMVRSGEIAEVYGDFGLSYQIPAYYDGILETADGE